MEQHLLTQVACCLFAPELHDILGVSPCRVSGIRLIITHTPHCCLARLCRQICGGAEGRGRECRIRNSYVRGFEWVFYITTCRRVWQVCSGVSLNGVWEDLLLGMSQLYVYCLLVLMDVGICRWVCGRLVWTEMVPMSYFRVPQAPPFLQCCHGNCSGSLLLEMLRRRNLPDNTQWSGHSRSIGGPVENLRCYLNVCFTFVALLSLERELYSAL